MGNRRGTLKFVYKSKQEARLRDQHAQYHLLFPRRNHGCLYQRRYYRGTTFFKVSLSAHAYHTQMMELDEQLSSLLQNMTLKGAWSVLAHPVSIRAALIPPTEMKTDAIAFIGESITTRQSSLSHQHPSRSARSPRTTPTGGPRSR